MPTRPPRFCSQPGCHKTATKGSRCPEHAKPAWRTTTTSSTARGYGANWSKLRMMKLRADPMCEVCQHAPAVQVDHIKAKAHGGTDDPSNLQSICRECHQAKTSREGFEASRRAKQ